MKGLFINWVEAGIIVLKIVLKLKMEERYSRVPRLSDTRY